MDTDCVFCGIVAGTIPSTTVYQDDQVQAFMDINPSSQGHLLVIPKRHHRDLLDTPEQTWAAVSTAGQRLARAAVDALGADGVNLINSCGAAAWQDVFHVHLHVVPRYGDQTKDRLQRPWKPVPGDLDAIAATGARLRNQLS